MAKNYFNRYFLLLEIFQSHGQIILSDLSVLRLNEYLVLNNLLTQNFVFANLGN